ncbi:lipoprotein, putative [Citrifermentans bemidjiense Bem]|uniref:Lipoprotein, putative n=1 Tax=Citrifermentans bemidjiense (strain ATCC BAA-1014 / DSM 16622 / JCM 12645 / Bem) TaxID=404380 RepID=B5E8I6_CITBB|nr:disulfide isomerase DsbC N-terminal domain-containing protein [Citrifermentans bemidjiense]ACH38571.1 lipoprotein, putative [Citrifermentans bemidjiense Bem]
MFKNFLVLTLMVLSLAACSKPPAKEQVQAAIKKFIPVNFEVLQLSELKEVPGLYEVVVSVNQQPVVFYVDKKAKHVFSGSVLSVDTKGNLTVETQKKFQKK